MSDPFSAFKSHTVQAPAPQLAPLRRKGSRAIQPDELDNALSRALADGSQPQLSDTDHARDVDKPREIGGPSGPEPTRYGDWEVGGIASDF